MIGARIFNAHVSFIEFAVRLFRVMRQVEGVLLDMVLSRGLALFDFSKSCLHPLYALWILMMQIILLTQISG